MRLPSFTHDTRISFTDPIGRLHPVPPPTRPHQESNVTCMDRGTSIRADYAAGGGSAGGQFEIKMGEAETVHDWRCFDCGCLSVDTGVDRRDSTAVCERAGDGW